MYTGTIHAAAEPAASLAKLLILKIYMSEAQNKTELLEAAQKKLEALISETGIFQDWTVRQEVRAGRSPDLVVELTGGPRPLLLLIEARTSGEPRFAREAVNSLLVSLQQWSHAAAVFAAPYISEDAAEICRENNVAYMDLAGNCRIALDTLFIHTRGHPNPYKNKRRLKSLGRPKSARILRVLLNHPRRHWQTRELAAEAGVSLGLVSNVKRILRDREWIDDRRQKIVLTRPEAVLSHWQQTAGPAAQAFYYTAAMDFIEVENTVIELCRENGFRCAFTGLSGAVHLASGIDYYRRVQAYISGDFDHFVRQTGFERSAPKQANVILLRPTDPGVFYGMRPVQPAARLRYCRPSEKTVKTIEAQIRVPMHIVSPVQVYFDLAVTLKEGAQEAEKVLKQVIEPSW